MHTSRAVFLAAALALAGCNDNSKLPEQATTGPSPTIPAPNKSLIPTVNIATAESWKGGPQPKAAAGLAVDAFATGLTHPRWLYVLPNGDVLAAETDGPERPGDSAGIKGWVSHIVQQWAGAEHKSPDRIVLLRDANCDGIAETHSVF